MKLDFNIDDFGTEVDLSKFRKGGVARRNMTDLAELTIDEVVRRSLSIFYKPVYNTSSDVDKIVGFVKVDNEIPF